MSLSQSEAPAVLAADEPAPLAAVSNAPQPSGADTLILETGEELTGTILNERFSLRTFYGELDLDRAMIVEITRNGGTQPFESILAVNGNRFSGFLNAASFLMRLEAGRRVEVRRERVRTATFRARPVESEHIPRRHSVRLSNGDSVSGTVLNPSFVLNSTNSGVSLRPSAVEFAALTRGKTLAARIRMSGGDVLHGTLATEDIEIQLDLGPRLRLYRDWIDAICTLEEYFPSQAAWPEAQLVEAASSPASHSASPKAPDGLVWIAPGKFLMGSPTDEADRGLDEGPQTEMTIPRGFWMGKCEVTQGEYLAVMGNNPSHYAGDPTRPVEKVGWQDAMDYCAKLTAKQRVAGVLPDGYAYRLPTEAEWEYACRAGTTTRFSYGDDLGCALLEGYAWFTGNSQSSTHPVGTKRPNPWGLYDMHGNVWEWCLDHWGGSDTTEDTASSRSRPSSLRGARGGSWLYDGRFCRSANRDDYFPSNRCSDLGFRVVLAPTQP